MTGQLNERSLLQMKITIFSIILNFCFGPRALNAGLFTLHLSTLDVWKYMGCFGGIFFLVFLSFA